VGFQILAFVGMGVICSIIANLPALLKRENADGVALSNRRLMALIGAQSLLFAGYGLLVSVMRRESWITSLIRAAVLGVVLGLIPIVFGGRQTRGSLLRTVPLGLTIAACTVAAFVLTPVFQGD
jgi:hypothetical protein